MLTIGCTLLILVAVLLPGSNVPDVGVAGIDKVAHFVLFAIWVIALRRDFGGNFKWHWGFLIGLFFSVLTEVAQIVVEGRSFDVTDIVADACGLLFGLLTGPLVLRWVSKFVG